MESTFFQASICHIDEDQLYTALANPNIESTTHPTSNQHGTIQPHFDPLSIKTHN